jgi:hypothetical protein
MGEEGRGGISTKYKINIIDVPGNYREMGSIELPDGAIPLSAEVRARLDDADLPFHIWIKDPHCGYKFYTRIYYFIKEKMDEGTEK